MDVARVPFLFAIRCYQALHGSFFWGTCRFHPTCSQYAIEAIETRGIGKAILLAAWRIIRCQPFCKGGWDPVPASPDRNPDSVPDGRGPVSASKL